MEAGKRLAALLEAFLFIQGEPVKMAELLRVTGESEARVREALDFLSARYAGEDVGICLRETGAGISLATKQEYDAWLSISCGKEGTLSTAAVETLAVVAAKEPVTRAEIERIRGVSAGRILASLMEKDLVEERGREETLGRPILYGTTKRFLAATGLSDVKELQEKWAKRMTEGDLF